RKIEVVLCGFLGADDFDEVRHVFAGDESIGNFVNGVFGNEILRLAFLELGAGVDQNDFAATGLRLVPVENNDNSRSSGVVKKVVRKQDHPFDHILLDKPFADFLFAILGFVAAAARDCAGIEHNGGAA